VHVTVDDAAGVESAIGVQDRLGEAENGGRRRLGIVATHCRGGGCDVDAFTPPGGDPRAAVKLAGGDQLGGDVSAEPIEDAGLVAKGREGAGVGRPTREFDRDRSAVGRSATVHLDIDEHLNHLECLDVAEPVTWGELCDDRRGERTPGPNAASAASGKAAEPDRTARKRRAGL